MRIFSCFTFRFLTFPRGGEGRRSSGPNADASQSGQIGIADFSLNRYEFYCAPDGRRPSAFTILCRDDIVVKRVEQTHRNRNRPRYVLQCLVTVTRALRDANRVWRAAVCAQNDMKRRRRAVKKGAVCARIIRWRDSGVNGLRCSVCGPGASGCRRRWR